MVEDYTIKAVNEKNKGKIDCPYTCSARGLTGYCWNNLMYNCSEYQARHKRDIEEFIRENNKSIKDLAGRTMCNQEEE